MRIAVLCPGDSLGAGGAGEAIRRCQVVISVNRAVLFWPCDFWVVRDLHTFLGMEPRERAGLGRVSPRTIVTSLSTYGQICRQWPAAEKCTHIDPGLLELPKRDAAGGRVAWPLFSATTAIAMAAELLPKVEPDPEWDPANQILCFGMDWKGEADWDGHTSEKNCRTVERWKKEGRIFGQMQDLLACSGIGLSRMTAEQRAAKPAGAAV